MISMDDLTLRLLPEEAYNEQLLRQCVVKALQGQASSSFSLPPFRVIKRSIDARQRQVFVNVTITFNQESKVETPESLHYKLSPLNSSAPVALVIGAGPGGLFAALRLIELGIRPIVLERGKNVHERKKDIALISREHKVNAESNYSFGEGGAGAFSDGKLYTRSKKRGNVERILRIFHRYGASEDILIDAHPHIGTDKLPRVIENMRNAILNAGGEVHFQCRMESLLLHNNEVVGVRALTTHPDGTTSEEEFHGPVILATGNAARDVYTTLYEQHIDIEAKGIAIGVRLEHPAHLIDQIQYHSREGRGKWLPAAEYSFVQQVEGRGVYSFCMCPGGFVVPAASGPEQLVVNGMSPSTRGSRWSNAGMVVEIHPEDIPHIYEDIPESPLMMMHLQERIERMAWQQGGYKQIAPAQRMADFVHNKLSYDLPESSYQAGLLSSPLHFWMPKFITARLQQGFSIFGRHSHGFLTNEATLIGVETRTSSPVRITRDNLTLQHIRIPGLYPCGEGAGYAGGIVSAAIDGERCAEALANQTTL